jgi:hypothetical protein
MKTAIGGAHFALNRFNPVRNFDSGDSELTIPGTHKFQVRTRGMMSVTERRRSAFSLAINIDGQSGVS